LRLSKRDATARSCLNLAKAFSTQYRLRHPHDDTRLIIAAAREGISWLYRDGSSYAKAQVLLLNLCRRDEYTQDLFAPEQAVKTEQLMSALDAINGRWGRGTLQLGRITKPTEWAMRREMLSPAYTTCWDSLPTAYAR
jgi:DNA polymerase V